MEKLEGSLPVDREVQQKLTSVGAAVQDASLVVAVREGSTIGSRTIFTTVCATRCPTVGMPRGRVPPLFFGISTSRTGGGKYEPDDMRFQTL
jgi:hypothetical protein